MIRSYKEFEVYQESYDLALRIHKITLNFPSFERFDLGSQMRRASKSIPANIAEGWAKRRFAKEFQHHLDISMGSASEMEVHLSIAKDLKYLSLKEFDELINRYELLSGKLVNLRNNWK